MIVDFYGEKEFSPNLSFQKSPGENSVEITTLNGKPVERSDYNPSPEARVRTVQVIRDFWYARQTMNAPYLEFNNTDVLTRLTEDQKSFNAWVPPMSEDPDEEWRSDAYDPIVRNKVISIAAHLTRALVFPQWEASNADNKEDKDAATVMNHLVEYAADQSNYVQNFLYAVVDALVTPAAIVYHEYAQVYRTVKEITAEKQENGTYWIPKMVVDEELSGFQDTLLGVDELFVADAYIQNVQLQPCLIWRRVIQYDAAYAKYHGNPNFDAYVREGVQLLFDQQTLVFYRQYDENLRGRMVEEVIYWNRTNDLRLVFVNGVLLTHPDQPNPRKDKKYPFVKGGYSMFNHRFFWYSSLVKSMSKNEKAVNSLYRMIIDGTYLQLIKPVAVTGEESIDSSVVIPGNIVNLKSDTKISPLDFGNNLSAGIDAYKLIRGAMSESAGAENDMDTGSDDPTALQISKEEQEARIMLGMFAKMISFMVRDWGLLMCGDILQHLTVGKADEELGPDAALKFQTFILSHSVRPGGSTKTKRIEFNPDLAKQTEDMPRDKTGKVLDFARLDEEGGLKGHTQIISVDPYAFRQLKYKCRVHAEDLLPPSDSVLRSLNIEEFDRLIQSPAADQEEALLLLLNSYPATRQDPDKYVSKQQQQPGVPGAGTVMPGNGAANNGIMPKNIPGGLPSNTARGGARPSSAAGALQRITGMSRSQRQPSLV